MNQEDLCNCDKIRTRDFRKTHSNCPDCKKPLRLRNLPKISHERVLFPTVEIRNPTNTKNSDENDACSELERLRRSFRNTSISKRSEYQSIGDLIEPATPVHLSDPKTRQNTEFWSITPRERSNRVVQEEEEEEELEELEDEEVEEVEEDRNRSGRDSLDRSAVSFEGNHSDNTFAFEQPRMENNGELKIPTPRFSGKRGENVKNFFSRFEKVAEHRNIGEDEMLEWLGLLLEGEALEQYDVIIAREEPQGVEGYRNVKRNIIKRFENEESEMAIRAKLANKKIKTNEDVTQYFCSIEKECNKLDDISENDILFLFLNGLDKDMKNYVLLQNPNNLQEAFELSKNFEMVHKMSGKVDAEARSETKSLIESLKNEAKASAAVSNNKMGIDDLREEMKQMVHASFNQMLNSMRNEGVVFRNNFEAGNFSCHRCKQPGHFIRDCPEPPGIQPGTTW